MFEEKTTFGAGCFWHIEEYYSLKKGIISTIVGYMGGHIPNPTYKDVCGGNTEHAEVVQISFNPSIISYKDLLDNFWKIHDPCSLNKQGHDIGSQYKSVIFFHNTEQKSEAIKQKKELLENKIYKEKIVTEIIPATKFYKAEDYHQQYFKKNPHLRDHCGI